MVLGAGLLALLVPFHAVELEAGAIAPGAPAVLGVEGEKPRVQLGEAAPAGRAGALRGEGALREVHLHSRRPGFRRSFGEAIESGDHVHDALAEFESSAKRPADFGFVVRCDAQVGDRQLERVLLEARQPRPFSSRQELAVHAQEFVTLAARPLGQVGVIALSVDNQRGEQADALPLVFAQKARRDRVLALRLDRHLAVGAVLRAELDVEQSEEMIDLGERRDGALAAAAAGPLLDRDRGRDAEDRVHVGARRALDELARVGVERLEIASLPFGEKYVEGKRGFPRARDAGDHGELVARDFNVDGFQVVLAGIVNSDRLVDPGLQRHAGLRSAKDGGP